MFHVIVAGSRAFNNFALLEKTLDALLVNKLPDVAIISGGAEGADKLGEAYAMLKGFRLMKYPAQWKKHGKSAGFKRNREMAEVGDALVAFWDKASRGTEHMINCMEEMDKPVRVVTF